MLKPRDRVVDDESAVVYFWNTILFLDLEVGEIII